MTRRLAIALLLLVLAIGAGVTPWPAPRAAIDALSRLAALGGPAPLRVAAADGATFTLLPEPRLQTAGLRVESPAGETLLTVERASASVRLASLLTGAFEVADLTLVRPKLAAANAASLVPGLGLAGPGSDARGRIADLDRMILIDGEATGAAMPIQAVNMVLRRRAAGLEAAGTLRLGGQALEVQVAGPRLDALLSGEYGPLAASLRTGHGSVDFSGSFSAGPNAPQANGSLTAALSNAPALTRWLGVDWPLPLGESASVTATLRLAGAAVALTDARIQTPAGALDGALSATLTAGHVGLSGTLAAERLDLTAALRPLFPARRADGSWSAEPIDLKALPAGDADLRLSAGRLTMGKTVFDNAALSLLSRAGRADVTLSSGDFLGGRVKGRATLVYGEGDGVDLKAQGSFERVDAALAALLFAGSERLTGAAGGSFAVDGSGASFAALVRSLDGKASVTIRQGELLGVNLPEVLRRIERRPLIAALDMRGGKTPFDVASFGGRIGKGVLDIADGSLASPATKVLLSGQVGLAERTLQLTGQVQSADQGRDAVVLPFAVSGSFDEPSVTPNASALFRKSGALAPQPVPASAVVEADLPLPSP